MELITMGEKKLVVEIEEELRTDLKIIALKQGKTIKTIVTELISDFVKENK